MVQYGQDVLRKWKVEELVEMSIDLKRMIRRKSVTSPRRSEWAKLVGAHIMPYITKCQYCLIV